MFKSRYGIILIYCLLSMVCFTLMRTVLYICSWNVIDHSLLNTLGIFGLGLVYDATFNVYVALFFGVFLFMIPNRILNSKAFRYITYLFFFGFLYFLYFSLTAEWFFWEEFKTRFNFIAVDYLVYRREVTDNMVESYPIPYILSGVFLVSIATFWMVKGFLRRSLLAKEGVLRRGVITLSIMALSLISYQAVGQSFRDARVNNYEKELCSNGQYQFVGAFRNNMLDYRPFYPLGPDPQISELAKKSVGKDPATGGLYDISRDIQADREERRLNVFIICVESLSADFLTRFGQKKNLTPFMDRWFKEGLFFTRFYATGTRTIRALEAITLSIPPTPGRSLVKRPDNANMYNLGKIFKDRSYDIAFLYGGRGYFDNMNAFYANNGFRVVDLYDFEDGEVLFQNAWGVSDGDLYRKAVKEANRAYGEGNPFFYFLMTTSNHRPYTYPEGRIDIPSKTNRAGAVKYTDWAIGNFLDQAREKPWFDNTLFVLVSDHTSHGRGRIDLPPENYRIPMWFYAPGFIEPGKVHTTASLIDLAPSVLALLNVPYTSKFFGQNILEEGQTNQRAFMANYLTVGYMQDDIIVELLPQKNVRVVQAADGSEISKDDKAAQSFIQKAISYYQLTAKYIEEATAEK